MSSTYVFPCPEVDQVSFKLLRCCWEVVELLLCFMLSDFIVFELWQDFFILCNELKEVPVFMHVFNTLFELLQSCCCVLLQVDQVCCRWQEDFLLLSVHVVVHVPRSVFMQVSCKLSSCACVCISCYCVSSSDKTSLFSVTNLQSACCCGHVVYMFSTGLHACCWVVVLSQVVFLWFVVELLCMLVMHSLLTAVPIIDLWLFSHLLLCFVVLSWVDWKQESMTEAASSEKTPRYTPR